ncbi:VOC family protein [Geomicrobium sp. JCM 19039]|uniref:VOC family protein n=1 Tax=Geomicrobium sp. JCM 19039 TaxID=1460636 RepID=UPI00045F2DED|nr:VOC family protein [Geomicrobium sp. JCM 19039]GAK10524.1 hypothetical protein JCM19039_145 [Geomicrobium sp. JCM 19039]
MLERVDTICVTVKDLQASIRWYHEKLQFTLLHQGEQYAILGFGDHSAPFTIEEGTPSVKTNTTYPIFYTSNITRAHQHLQELDVQVSSIEEDADQRFFTFYDPDNNKMQACFY